MKRNKQFKLGSLASIEAGVGVLSSVLMVGVTYGSLSTRVKALEQHPDPAPAIAEIKTGLDDLKSSVQDIKQDVKSLLRRSR